jgi:hypothetical protein
MLNKLGKAKVVADKTKYGVYVWEMPDGKWVGDDEGHYMLIPAVFGDAEKIKILKEAAEGYGVTEGEPKFLPGRRKVSDEEYAAQEARLHAGLTPDPWDLGEGLDAAKRMVQNGR